MRVLVAILIALAAAQTTPQTAREYYNEIYVAAGLDRMADEYVCFDEDATNPNFFIFGQSKTIREGMILDGTFTKLPKPAQAKLKQDWLIVHGYARGIPFDGQDFYEKDGNSWVSEMRKMDANHSIQIRFTVNWQTLRYKRAYEMRKLDGTFDSEIPRYGRCEEIEAGVNQTAEP